MFLGLFLFALGCTLLYLKFRYRFFDKNKTIFKSCERVSIVSSYDGETQEAFFYPAKSTQPLIVSLHSWGTNFTQADSLVLFAEKKGWNYIHPDYRGQQWEKNSCCYPASVQDIDDAIEYSIKNGNVDTSKIFIIGKSGGGTGVLAAFLKSKYKNLNCMAWAPIPDYVSWYREVLVNQELKEKYLEKILLGTNSSDTLNIDEAKLKSPHYFPVRNFSEYQNKKLTIYAGVYDGIKGSTSISQPIRFYNRLLKEWGVTDSSSYVNIGEHDYLLKERKTISPTGKLIGKREIVHMEEYKNVKLIIFKGEHELLLAAAESEIEK